MSLKDLVAEKSALAEAAIEEIVKDYVRYDPNEREIAFTPRFAELSNKVKVLVYLVALQGWPYVAEDAIGTEAKPAAIEQVLGIAGGTLRPLLKDLKDRHFLSYRDGSYGVRASSFDAVRNEIFDLDRGSSQATRRSRTSVVDGDSDVGDLPEAAPTEGRTPIPAMARGKRAGGARMKDVGRTFRAWVDEGFFDDGRTLGEVQARFHEEAIIIPQTSIPKYLLAAVRAKRLTRSKEIISGKVRWVYRSNK